MSASLAVSALFDVKDRVCLVTGGGRGIGLMLADALVQNGAHVYLCSRSAAACESAAAALTARGPGRAVALSGDLSTLQGCEAVAAALASRTSVLHVLVNNSGVSWGEPLISGSDHGFGKVFSTNVAAPFHLSRLLLPLLEAGATAERPSSVINVGSIAGLRPQVFPTFAYDASKSALHALSAKLAAWCAGKHVTVNSLAPGYVPTKMSNQLGAYMEKDALLQSIPLGRMGRAADMAGALLYLASPAGSWVTGIVLPVDGGSLLPTPKL
jgi:NAD(P)-dependent dehydrogenase (short-subunit alcohol dehydrogenase family)